MSTFLQLTNLVRSEAGIAGGDLLTLQSGLSAESQRIANWVNNEWLRVQRKKPDWQWMRQYFHASLTNGQAEYTVAQIGAAATPVFTAAQFGNWKRDSFRIYTSASPQYIDEMLATFMPWDQFRNVYLYGNMRQNFSRPVAFTVSPSKSLWFGMPPDINAAGVTYNVDGEYYQAPAALVLDADVPACPAFYHDWIMARALKAYGVFMSAAEVIGRAEELIGEVQPAVMADQLPIMESGPPLA